MIVNLFYVKKVDRFRHKTYAGNGPLNMELFVCVGIQEVDNTDQIVA